MPYYSLTDKIKNMKHLANLSRIFSVVLGLFVILSFPSCIKEEINLDNISDSVFWDRSQGMPIAYGSLSLADIIEGVDQSGYVKEGSDGSLYLLYRNNVFSQSVGYILPIQDQKFSQTFTTASPDFPSYVNKDSVKFVRESTFDFVLGRNDVEIDSMVMKMGFFVLKTAIEMPYPCRITITFPTLKQFGRPLKRVFYKNNSDPSFNDNTLVILADYKLSLDSAGGVHNKLPVEYEIMVRNNKGAIAGTNSISVSADLSLASFKTIFGYLGQITDLLNEKDQKITLDFFDNQSVNLNIEFDQPSITAYIRNSFGLPIRVNITNTRTYSERTSTYFPINFNPAVINVKYPTIQQVGMTVEDTIKVQSNFFDAVKTSPHYFYYDVSAIANPNGKVVKNFFTDTSKVNVDVELNLPLKFKATKLPLTDTLEFEPGNLFEDFDVVKKIVLHNTFVNSIPFDLNVQVYLADAQKVIVDSLYSLSNQPVIKTGVLDSGTGKYTFSEPSKNSVIFDETRSKKLENVKFAIVKLEVTTSGNGQNLVSFKSEYRLKVAFQVDSELSIRNLDQLF